MRITYLHQYYNDLQDAGSTRSYEMARRLVAKGHEVHLITSRREPNSEFTDWQHSVESGIHIYRLHVTYSNYMSYSQRMVAFLKFAILSSRLAASIPTDIVFATSTPLTIAFPAIYAARRLQVPMVFEVRDLWPEVPIALGALNNPISITLARWLESTAYRNAVRIVALSPGMRDGILKQGVSKSKVVVIPNGSDLGLFNVGSECGHQFRCRHAWLQDNPLVVYTGAHGRANGLSYLVRLASEAGEIMPDARFLTVGDGAERSRVQDLAESLGVLNRNFFMMASRPKSEIPAILSAADVATSFFIDLPELWPNSANKFFDALASGTPIVINYRGWQAELLKNWGAGIILPENNITVAAEALVSLLRDQSRLESSAAASRALAVELFDRDKLAEKLEMTLLDAISKGTSPE